MAVVTNKRSIMILYSGINDIDSQRVRILLAEKGVASEIEYMDSPEKLAVLRSINPQGNVPTLVDRDLIIGDINVISEYLDERFPHPPLMPVYPVARARARLVIYKIEKELYPLIKELLSLDASKVNEQKIISKEVSRYFTQLIPILNSSPYLLGEEFTIVDCALAPVLWRLPSLKVTFTPDEARVIYRYAERLFKRDSFQASLTEPELDIRKKELADAI